jgi:hypothetical protein
MSIDEDDYCKNDGTCKGGKRAFFSGPEKGAKMPRRGARKYETNAGSAGIYEPCAMRPGVQVPHRFAEPTVHMRQNVKTLAC